MEATIADFSKCEVRGVIRFLHHKGTSPIEIHRQLISAYGPNVMDIKNVRKWCRDSMQWRHPSSPTVKKFKTTPSAGKIMATVFCDRNGVLLIEYLPRGQTINADRYAVTLQNLKQAIRNKRTGRLTKGVCLLRDNARPHIARKILELLTKFGWDILDHPAYSPDLAPSDYHVFPALKEHLSGKRFEDDEEVTEAVNCFLREAGRNWYDAGIKKLVARHQKCVDRNGDYVEK